MIGISDESSVLVFAYGSNLTLPRMQARVPTAVPVAIGYVQQRRFVFRKRSIDGSAKADAAHTLDVSDRVWGVVYRMRTEHKLLLDKHEFLGVGYDEELVEVVLKDKAVHAWMYVARENAIDTRLLPYRWYHDLIIAGARWHGLPDRYIAFLKCFDSVEDGDAARDQENRKHLIPRN